MLKSVFDRKITRQEIAAAKAKDEMLTLISRRLHRASPFAIGVCEDKSEWMNSELMNEYLVVNNVEEG